MISASLDAASLRPLIEDCYLADAVQKYKPSPEIYQGWSGMLERRENRRACGS